MRIFYLFPIVLFIGIVSSRAQNTQPLPPRPFYQTHTTSAVANSTTYAANVPRSSSTEPNPPFVMSAPNVRVKGKSPKTGYSVGVWIGANPLQDGNWTVGGAGVEEKSKAWLGAGVKLGYTWPFTDDPILQFQDEIGGEGLRLAGGLEGEGFYVGSSLRPRVAGVERKVDLESAVFMMNFLLKGQAGNFRPYIGPGFGCAAIFADEYDVPGRTKNDDSDLAFAFQTLAGCDYFIDRDWSIFGEYRFLLIHDADFYNTPVNFKTDELDQHIFALGVRRHF